MHPSSVVQLAAVAIAEQGQYGVVTDLAREHGIRRQEVYDFRERGRAALEAEFETVQAAISGSFVLEVTPADIERAVVALRVVTPASIRDIVAMVPILYGVDWSYGTVWNVLNVAESRAAAFLKSVDLSGIESITLDEMFSQGRPVLAGLDLDTQYLFQLEVKDSRSGEAWAQSLGKLRDNQRLRPKRVVKDAGTGLAAGVQQCWPGIDEHDDLFHAVYKMGQEAYHLERGAYSAIVQVDKLLQQRVRARNEAERRSVGQQLRQAVVQMDAAIERYDRFEALRREAVRVLQLTDRGSGRLRTPAEILATLTRVADQMTALGSKRVRGVARYIRNRATGLGMYLDHLSSRLQGITEQAGGSEVVEATVRAYQATLAVSQGGPAWDYPARAHELCDATRHLLAMTEREPERLQRAVGTVMPLLAHRYRASSAIENLNSVLRPYLVVQKHAEQGFLDLFRYHWNTRTRQWGQWKGTSAYEMLTGDKVDDWLTLLGFPPGEALKAAA
jgi:hypothetical protein